MDNQDISIHLINPIVRDLIKKYVSYTLQGIDSKGPFEVDRRYSDFQLLRKQLVQKWPGCFVPPIPPKQEVGNLEPKFIEDRRNHLDIFCQRISQLPHLFYSDDMEVFKRSQSQDLEKAFSNLPKQDIQQIYQKQQKYFSHLNTNEQTIDQLTKINQFLIYVRRAGLMLENFKNKIKSLQTANEKYSEQQTVLLSFLLPEYEKQCQTEYCNETDHTKIVTKSHRIVKGYCDTLKEQKQFDPLLDMIRVEIWDIDAFTEIYQNREKFQQSRAQMDQKYKDLSIELSNLQQGKTSVKGLFSSGDKNQQLLTIQKQIDIINKDISDMQVLIDFLNLLILQEIQKFKEEKEANYYHVMKGITSALGVIHERSTDVWADIKKQLN